MARKRVTLDGIEAVSIFDPETGTGELHFTFADTVATVERDGEEIGEVRGCLGGGFEIRRGRSPKVGEPYAGTLGETYYVSARALWEAFERAIESSKGDGA